MRLRLPRRRLWRVAIYLVSLDLVLTAADLVLVQALRPIQRAYDTTRIISPTLPDGRVDYLTFLDEGRSADITPLNNAAVPFLQAIGRSALPPNQPPNGVTDRLGMPHLPEQGDYLTGWAGYLKTQANGLSTKRQWIDANARPLDLLVEASRRSRFFIPFNAGHRPDMAMEVYLSHVNALPNVGSMLLERATSRLDSGDSAGCIEDLLAVHRLARLLAQCPTLLERMQGGEQLESPALHADRVIAASGKLSADQVRSLAAQLRAMGDLPPIANYLETERILVLDLTQALAAAPGRFQDVFHDPGNKGFQMPTFCFSFIPIPWESNMRALNHTYDGALAALRQKPYSHRRAALELWQQRVESIKKSSAFWQALSLTWSSDFYVSMLMFSVPGSQQKEDIEIMERRLSELSLALAVYKADHGQYPAALADLAPAYLPAIPVDLFSEGRPLYHPTSAGYTLYSVGPDMIDNLGDGDDIRADVPLAKINTQPGSN